MMFMKINRKSLKMLNNSIWDLPTPTTASYAWNFGFLLGTCLSIQLVTGFILSMQYVNFSMESFNYINKIMTENWYSWLTRMIHMNSASLFFAALYLHIFRGVYYSSFNAMKLWASGLVIYTLLMAIAFTGYVLPWGQMSYWAVAVITNLFSVLPYFGKQMVMWIWGSYSVSTPTLIRFYSLHFLIPFILTTMVMLHLYILHQKGSSNPLGVKSSADKIEFQPFFTIKDIFFAAAAVSAGVLVSFYTPYSLADPLNNVPANPMMTPPHIQPEWYFLTSYAILRALPSKTLGVLALLASILVYIIPSLMKPKFSSKFTILKLMMFWIYFSSFMLLMKMGMLPAEEPYILVSKLAAFSYFTSIVLLNACI